MKSNNDYRLMNNPELHQVMTDAKTVVIAIFNRFGDSVIGAVVCREFIEFWSSENRKFLILTSPQLYPYISKICPSAKVIAFNKRNPVHWICFFFNKIFIYKGFDVGLNPCSYGKEARYLAKTANWHVLYRKKEKVPILNYYDRIREYLALPLAGDFSCPEPPPEKVLKILVCPESSDTRRTLLKDQLSRLIFVLKSRWPEADISIAVNENSQYSESDINVFFLRKNKKNSKCFIDLIQKSDLLVCVDSGPLHIATALGVHVVAIFSSAHPATVINARAKAWPLRSEKLNNKYCERTCHSPKCMDDINLDRPWKRCDEPEYREIIRDMCSYEVSER